jgi:hypothetical protein
MKVKLHSKVTCSDSIADHQAHAVICRYSRAAQTLNVFASPKLLSPMMLALRADDDGECELGSEATWVLLSLLRLRRMPHLVISD